MSYLSSEEFDWVSTNPCRFDDLNYFLDCVILFQIEEKIKDFKATHKPWVSVKDSRVRDGHK